jgi:hypothetical protein
MQQKIRILFLSVVHFMHFIEKYFYVGQKFSNCLTFTRSNNCVRYVSNKIISITRNHLINKLKQTKPREMIKSSV